MRTTRFAPFALLALFAAAAASAQQQEPVAKLKDVVGNVLVTSADALVPGTEAMPLVPRTRVLTTSASTVIVVYDNGCEVKLEENQRFEVETDKACDALVALNIATTAPAVAAVGPALGSLLGGAGALGAGAAAVRARERTPVSPN